MTAQAKQQISTFQGRAMQGSVDPLTFRRRMRLPIATLGVGLIAALAISGGALDGMIAKRSLTGSLTELEFLTGELMAEN